MGSQSSRHWLSARPPWVGRTFSTQVLKVTLTRNFVDDEHMCRWLTDNGATADICGKLDVTPLSVALRRSSMSTIKLLLERCCGVQGGQLLHFAVDRDKEDVLEVIELLCNLGCAIDGIMFWNDQQLMLLGETGPPLLTAVQLGKADIVAYLLRRGADPTILSSKGRTPLQVAEANGDPSIISLLKQRG